jgi:type IX secretion system PorP/SprF family membrane protein
MSITKKYIGGLLLISISITNLAQNQFHLSQYMVHQPFINPASMGAFDNLNGALFYKNQWVGFDGAPKLQGINLNSPVGNGKNLVGFTFVNDKIGVNSQMEMSGSYGYRMKTSDKSHLTLGLSATMRMIQSDFANVETSVVDPLFQANSPTLIMPNFKFGAYFNTDNFYVGFAMPNLLHNDIQYNGGEFVGETSFDIQQTHFYLHSGYRYAINEKLDLNSSVLFKQVAGAPFQTDINVLLEFNKRFGIGTSFRTSKEIIALAQFRINSMFKLAYAYDYNLGELNNYSSGSHEIMLILDFKGNSKKPAIEAPRF